MDSITDPQIEKVVFCSAAQIGKTEGCVLNVIGYFCDQDPSPILIVLPTENMAQALSRDRVSTMIRDTPVLRNKFSDPRSRDSDNTKLHKKFIGGHLTLTGSNSSASLSARSIRIVLMDEVDRFASSIAGEGSPIMLAERRAVSFFNRKIIMTSTPTVRGESAIEAAYENSDQRKYYVPCPHCDEYTTLEWKNVVWDEGHPEGARYKCGLCENDWTEQQRIKAIQQGEWRATAEHLNTAGFHLNGIYSPFVTPAQAAVDFVRAKNHPEMLRSFINLYLAEGDSEDSEQLATDDIMQRRELYDHPCPEGVLAISSGTDVQKDRLECMIVGHGKLDETWVLDHKIIYGSPTQDIVWNELQKILQTPWTLPNGRDLPIAASFIDSGYLTPEVYKFCRRMQGFRIHATKGVGGIRPPVGRPSKSNSQRLQVFPIGVNGLKESLFTRLKVQEKGPSYVHIPDHMDDEWCQQLVSEKAVKKYTKGISRIEWVKTRSRNEALDLMVLNLAAFVFLNVNTEWVAQRLEDVRKTKSDRPKRRRNWVSKW